MFIVGTIFLRNRDRRDEQRRERRQFEERISREWRQFAEKISGEYSKLKDKGIPRKISQVKENFEKLSIILDITGVDVLRYMLDDDHRQHFKTTELENLREDLQSIFQLFNVCSSLLLLGEVPTNIKEELKDLVTDLGEMTYPLFKGERRKIILKCVENFGSSCPKPETESRVSELDASIGVTVPYVDLLRFGTQPEQPYFLTRGVNAGRFVQSATSETELDYSIKCTTFSLNRIVTNQGRNQGDLTFLTQLHKDLEDPRYMTDFATRWRELKPEPFSNLIKQVNHNDTNEVVLVKFTHEVRVYIHLFLNDSCEQINLTTLRNVWKKVTALRPTEAMVKKNCERFIMDLQGIQESPYHCNSQEFCVELTQLWNKLGEIQIIRENNRPEN
ncbi:hypothetical protein OS493_010493 [Desmophyllum pertusum]|uniref:Uncharacterized protein n=1 Tax=Desmophyllum pertusum TaxID=174260 RepID=A0A9X0DBN4_9CNID|nr:hypothetical protein OS493_010493 [Desmophyllum pertusum]